MMRRFWPEEHPCERHLGVRLVQCVLPESARVEQLNAYRRGARFAHTDSVIDDAIASGGDGTG